MLPDEGKPVATTERRIGEYTLPSMKTHLKTASHLETTTPS